MHTWDLGEAIGAGHAPDPRDAHLIRQVWPHLGRSVTEEGDPWAALLQASGRVPDEFDEEVVVARDEARLRAQLRHPAQAARTMS